MAPTVRNIMEASLDRGRAGRPSAAKREPGRPESSAQWRSRREPAVGGTASTPATANRDRRFHRSGRGLGLTVSLPMKTNVPSLRAVHRSGLGGGGGKAGERLAQESRPSPPSAALHPRLYVSQYTSRNC